MNPLDLYAKIEPFIGFYDQYEILYKTYLRYLSSYSIGSVLDVGCGNGKFLKHLLERHIDAEGIDRSASMIQRANEIGVRASCKELEDFEAECFDCVTAVADVLNYIPPKELAGFFHAINRVLKPKGYFVCDVNTLYGFEAVAEGVMRFENETQFLCIEANYADKELLTHIAFFEKEGELYRKHSGQIRQYFHTLGELKKQEGFRLETTEALKLFGDSPDKTLLVYRKR
ncbi:class I SAM-dependent methyltransferase [Sulfurospirillum sp. MES]|uniref:class I SAM-dependent DNA methyltransferase n=1 Tax=Sulfurospirillum sp. MES TaxID=1565314 RepID=UPI0005442C4E|nr:class I SAM-dependent methyltransferase [Sulfurospirillum sp. MES]KHG35065.1 MAG: methyltransferase type 11 [Sulfurospirillum sp. MES]